MSLAALRKMAEMGLSIDQAIEVMEAMECDKPRSSGAERQARYRERKADSVTSDVTRDVTSSDADPLPLPPSPQTPQPPTPTPGEGSIARKGPSRIDVSGGFVGFWSAYPKRVGKDAASKAFAKAMARIEDADPLAVILAGIERALPGWDDPQFIPHPATWLNQGRWDDEAPTPRIESRNDRFADNHRPASSYGQPSRAERDQSAALRVLARRGVLPGPDQGRGVHDLDAA